MPQGINIENTDAHFIPRNRGDWRMIRQEGVIAWLTWASLSQAVEDEPLHWWQKFFRWLFC